MNEPSISVSQLWASILWTVTAVLLLGGWFVYPLHFADLALMLATSACITGLGATTLTVRCVVKRYTRVILQGMVEGGRSDRGVRTLRP